MSESSRVGLFEIQKNDYHWLILLVLATKALILIKRELAVHRKISKT